mgnify:CR=1 FL=1
MEKNFKDLLASMLADLDEGKSVEEIVTKKMKEANLSQESQAKVSEAVGYVDKLDAAKQNLDAALKKGVSRQEWLDGKIEDLTDALPEDMQEMAKVVLDEATNKWGVKVNRVELQDIIPPHDIQSAMEKQMKAERDRRAAILEAEGLKKSAVLKAEGEKEAAINRAEGEKQSKILRAEGIAQARVLEADGEKEAINRIITALENKGKPDQYLIAMKYLETMKEITSGKDNKVVYMPYEATGILSSVDGIKEMFKGTAK